MLALLFLGCTAGRGTCRSNSDCTVGTHCSSGRCLHDLDAGADGGTRVSDAGNDAAAISSDAGRDAATLPSDAGRDAATIVDAGHDASRDAGHVTSSIPLLFSEYVEGTGNNKALEIANLGTTTFDLSQCHIDDYANGGTTPMMVALTGTLAAGAVFTMCNSGASGFTPSTCTVSNGGAAVSFNGNDAIALVCMGMTVDVIGQIGNDPGTGWGTTVSTANQTLRRNCSVTSGDTNGANAFDPAAEWTNAGADVFSGLGTRGCP